MGNRLARYKKALVAAVGVALSLATAIAGTGLVPADSTAGRIITAVIAIGTVVTVAKVRNAPQYNPTPTLRSGPPPVNY